jgi:hypothetical protein
MWMAGLLPGGGPLGIEPVLVPHPGSNAEAIKRRAAAVLENELKDHIATHNRLIRTAQQKAM